MNVRNSKEREFGVIILAAGKGTRMESDTAKVLHMVASKPMLHYVIATAKQLQPSKIAVVVGHQADKVKETFKAEKNIDWVMQDNPRGTGDAVARTSEVFKGFKGPVMVLYGDIPGIKGETLRRLRMMHESRQYAVTILSADIEDPTGYGRVIIAADGSVSKIVEEKDANLDEKEVTEINTGIGIYEPGFLFDSVKNLTPTNKQNELYLTDLVSMARESQKKVACMQVKESFETQGVNDRGALADVARFFYDDKAAQLLELGVTLEDPASITIEPFCEVAADTQIEANVVIRGDSKVGKQCILKTGVVLQDAHLEDNVHLGIHTVIK